MAGDQGARRQDKDLHCHGPPRRCVQVLSPGTCGGAFMEISSLQEEVVRTGLHPGTGGLNKKRVTADTEQEGLSHKPRTPGPPEASQGGKEPPREPPEGAWPRDTLTWDFWPQNRESPPLLCPICGHLLWLPQGTHTITHPGGPEQQASGHLCLPGPGPASHQLFGHVGPPTPPLSQQPGPEAVGTKGLGPRPGVDTSPQLPFQSRTWVPGLQGS